MCKPDLNIIQVSVAESITGVSQGPALLTCHASVMLVQLMPHQINRSSLCMPLLWPCAAFTSKQRDQSVADASKLLSQLMTHKPEALLLTILSALTTLYAVREMLSS